MRKFLLFFIPIVFLIISIATLPHYGINWDTINHLPRGQSYLHFFLTGKRDFSDLPRLFEDYEKPDYWYWQNPSSLSMDTDIPNNAFPRVSLYQKAGVDFNYSVDNDGGHPPISDILSSLFNWVLFQKLGIINDIDSYRIYGIFLSSLLVGLIFFWVSKNYSNFTGLIAALSLAMYPLFWSESHFNTEKDIPETVYISFLLFSVWRAVIEKKWQWAIVSGIFFGLALGTKFNVIFTVFIIIPWLGIYLISNYFKNPQDKIINLLKYKKLLLSAILAPFIGLFIFIISWPYLWQDPITRIMEVVNFYKGIGLTNNIDERFVWFLGINTYPIRWIIYTTPLVILFLTTSGIFFSIKNILKDNNYFTLLILLWLIVPITRVIWPGTTIYGGIRQIMEYIPPLAILTGIGVFFLREYLSKFIFKYVKYANLLIGVIIILMFLPLLFRLIQIHPNENVYFNSLIGGLSGAKEKNLPSWGNSFGAAYRQGVIWLNHHAERGVKVAYARELIPNIPRIWLRQDLNLHNSNRSGTRREGEYIIGLIYQGTEQTSYFDKYLERFLEPVYQVQVDGVSILKIWKNDLGHTKEEYLNEVEIREYNITKETSGITFDFGKLVTLSRIEWEFNNIGCSEISLAFVRISKDGQNWDRLPGSMPKEDWSVPKLGNQPKENSVLIPFAAEKAKYVNIIINPSDACLFNQMNIRVFSLPKVL